MKTKFSIELHRSGSFNDAVLSIITNHNEGLVKVNFSTIIGFINGSFCRYPTVTPKTECKINYAAGIMEIVEGTKHTMTIHLKELEELKEPVIPETQVDDIPTLFLQGEGLMNDNAPENIN